MPDQQFTVHIDPDDLARRQLTATVAAHAAGAPEPEPAAGTAAKPGKHGTRDERLAARQRSGRDHAGRAAEAASSRSYAFRRS